VVTFDLAIWTLLIEAIYMQILIYVDYSAMVKYFDNYDLHYIMVWDRLYECVKKASSIIENRSARGLNLGECMWIFEILIRKILIQ